MKILVALLILLLIPVLSWAATCTISGVVYNPDGTPLANGQVQFNSVVTQVLGGGASVPVQFISTTTDPHGNLKPFAVVQGLQGQFVFCNPMAGGCSAPTPALIPLSATADISAILAGIQLASGGNVNANSLNVTGNTTLGGTLVVTGASTFNGSATFNGGLTLPSTANACFADLGCWQAQGIIGVTHVGIGTLPAVSAVILQAGETALVSKVGTADALGTNINVNWLAGGHMNTSGQWIADVTYPMWFNQVSNASNGPENGFMVYGPQTVGQPLSTTGNRVQYMALRANVSGVTPGLFLESGGINVINGGASITGGALGGGLTVEWDQSNATIGQVINSGGSATSNELWRASNSVHVIDMAQPAFNYGTSGFFVGDRGYVASNGGNGLLIEATGTNGSASSLYLAAPNANRVAVAGNAHFSTENDGYGLPVAQSNCGAGSAVQSYSTDNEGYVYVGGPTTACQVNFYAGQSISGKTPICMCNGYTSGTTVICNAVAILTGVTLNFNVSISGQYIPWMCMF